MWNAVLPSYALPHVPCHGAVDPRALGGAIALFGNPLFGGGPEGGGGRRTLPAVEGAFGWRGGGGGIVIMGLLIPTVGGGGDMGGGGGGTWKGRVASLCPGGLYISSSSFSFYSYKTVGV